MDSIDIRKAEPKDLETLLHFEQGVIAAERPFDPTLKDGTIHYYDIPRMLGRDDVEFVVAERDSSLIGCGFARLEAAKPYLKHRTQAYLGLMYVDPAYRGAAVNGRILEALERWCRSKGVREMRLEVYQDNLAAVRAYEKAGFSKFYLVMRMHLCDE